MKCDCKHVQKSGLTNKRIILFKLATLKLDEATQHLARHIYFLHTSDYMILSLELSRFYPTYDTHNG